MQKQDYEEFERTVPVWGEQRYLSMRNLFSLLILYSVFFSCIYFQLPLLSVDFSQFYVLVFCNRNQRLQRRFAEKYFRQNLKPAAGRYCSIVSIHVTLQWLRMPSSALRKLIEIRCGPIRLAPSMIKSTGSSFIFAEKWLRTNQQK